MEASTCYNKAEFLVQLGVAAGTIFLAGFAAWELYRISKQKRYIIHKEFLEKFNKLTGKLLSYSSSGDKEFEIAVVSMIINGKDPESKNLRKDLSEFLAFCDIYYELHNERALPSGTWNYIDKKLKLLFINSSINTLDNINLSNTSLEFRKYLLTILERN